MRRLWALGMLAAISGCATTPPARSIPQLQAGLAAGGPMPPPVADCPFVADVDLAAIVAEQGRRAQEPFAIQAEAYLEGLFEQVTISGDGRRPGADSPVILTGVEPPGGLYSNTVWSVVWREADGRWWFWRQNRTNEPPPPPPYPPGPDATEAEKSAHAAAMAQYPPPDHVRWPPTHGLLSAAQAAAVDQSLANSCRAWEPDRWPWDAPLRRARAQPGPPPPQDWSPFHVWIQEMGRPPRLISAPNGRESHVGVIKSVASYPRP